jgi:hypothetical protein
MLQLGKEKFPSIINDPFLKDKITDVSVRYGRKLFGDGEWECNGYVYFQNGSTKGEQSFKDETFDGCVAKMKQFIESL